VADEITNAELARRLDSFHRDVQDDLANLNRRLDAFVLREVYAADRTLTETRLTSLDARIADEKRARELAEERQRVSVRWWWSAVLIPIIALITSIVLQAAKP
jgi:hypothetical protein